MHGKQTEENKEVKGYLNGSPTYSKDEIFTGVPEDNYTEVDIEELDPDDFDDADILEETHENFEEGKKKISEEAETVEQEDIHPTEEERSEKAEEIRQKIVSMINPKTIVGFASMFISRGGAMAMTRSRKKDWKFDEEEKELLTEILEVMIEEEGIHLWPAKIWLIIALVFILAMKGYDNYRMYYTNYGLENKSPEMILEERQKEHNKKLADIDALEKEAELIERRARAEARIEEAKKAIREGRPININGQDTYQENKNEDNQEEQVPTMYDLLNQFPPDKYVWKNGDLQYKADGTPKKKPGAKPGTKKKFYQDPRTKKFITKEAYIELAKQGIVEDDEILAELEEESETDEDPDNEINFAEVEEV